MVALQFGSKICAFGDSSFLTFICFPPFASRGYVGIHASAFKDFLLKPELLRALVDCGFEFPSEVQQECIPQAVLGMDVICQAKSGMGKTAVFVLATLHQLEPVDGEVAVLVMCHTRELAYQIKGEYDRFSKYLTGVKSEVIFGGMPEREQIEMFKSNCPHVVVATPGRIKSLVAKGAVKLDKLKHFVLDECDRLLEELGESCPPRSCALDPQH